MVTAFSEYLETNDKSLIENFSNDILEKTLNYHMSSTGDRNTGWFRAFEKELKPREKSKDHKAGIIKGIIIGVATTVVGGLILWLIISKLIGE